MKQLLQNLRSGETVVADVPVPTPKPGTALVRTAASLVSAGTERTLVEFAEKSLLGKARSRPDLVRQVLDKARREGLLSTIEAAFGRLEQPIPLGYSSAGTVVALGEGLAGLQVGQRVACAGGSYAVHAEYVVVPRNLLVPLPEGVDFEGAAFTTLGAIAMHGFRLSEAALGERVAVIGLGLLGLLMVGIAHAAGCAVLGIDLDPERVALAERLGATAVLRPAAEEAAGSFSRGRGCDAVLICADTPSNDPVELAGALARDRARVVATGAVGLNFPRKVYYEKELSFVNSRSYGPGRYDPAYEERGQDYPIGYVRWTEGRNLESFLDLLAGGRLDVRPLVTHRFPVQNAPAAYELITGKKKEPFLGVLLTYPEEASPASTERGEIAPLAEPPPVEGEPPPLAGAAPAGVGGVLAEPPPASSAVEKIKLGVLGAGNFASTVLLPAVKKVPEVELVGIASASGLSARNAADRFGFRFTASEEERILQDPEINTVAILTRHHLHARQVLAALEAGKHVFCEKPLAIRPAELEEVWQALQGSGREGDFAEGDYDKGDFAKGDFAKGDFAKGDFASRSHPLLTVGFNRRFAPLAQRLQAFLSGRQEPLVAHYRVNAGLIPLNHWVHDPEQGGGRIIGEGCHFIDFLTFLVGAPPRAVTARSLPDGGRYQEDNAVMTFVFPDRSIGTVTYLANGDKSFPKERVEVFSGGRAAALDDYRTLELVRDGRREVGRARLRQDKGHQAEWEAFAAALSAGGPPPIPYDQLFGVHRAAFAAVEALRTGEEIACQGGA
jgi:predicted dehydrogenase